MKVKIVKHLSDWYREQARDLPWRKNADPYSIWLSEIMLQQTQVATVIPYFERFQKKFPSVHDLAKSSIEDVYQLWAGLGYYSRARNLHKGAQFLSEQMRAGKGFPKTRAELLEVPGIGEYTAGAVSSIAFNLREPIVDGNVVRVIARLFAIGKIDSKKTEIWKIARELVEEKSATPKILNQALMELGALVCRPKNPKCDICPVSKECKGKKHPEKYPPPKAKVIWKRVQESKWVLTTSPGKKDVHIFLIQNDETGWRQGLWDFPNADSISSVKKAKLKDEFMTKYTVTNHKIERKHAWFEVSAPVSISKGKWFKKDEIPGVPAPVKKVLKKIFL